MEFTKLEKAALFTAGAGAAFKALLWSLGAEIDSTNEWIIGLRIAFAVLSFVSFDLVIGAVVMRGWSVSGAAALAVAALMSAAIALEVAKVWQAPALHAAPALTLAAFGLHLMLGRRTGPAGSADLVAPAATPTATATAAVQVNVAGGAAIPETVAALVQHWAAQLPQHTPSMLAAKLGTSPDTVRRALAVAATAEIEREATP